ncbi:glycosyltransferase [Flavihumibacter sediminis]|nr:glycosyltransferase [Flavihumibacter sediminis]
MKKKYNKVVVGIYIHPDFYPPTINAILGFAEVSNKVIVVTRNNSKADYPFPDNVEMIKSGVYSSPYDSEKKSTASKIASFLKFTFSLMNVARQKNIDLLLLYDSIPLLSFYFTKVLIPKSVLVWYHNHDMPNVNKVRKYSIGWFSSKYEFSAMRHIQYFSLPSTDRLIYYPEFDHSIPYFYLPNFPSLKVYSKRNQPSLEKGPVRILFQGSIGEGHALEEIILLLTEKINGQELELVLKGPVRDSYRDKLSKFAEEHGVSGKVKWIGVGPYHKLPEVTQSCHIGIAIYMGKDNVSKTLGTASNKIYEYAACGLPVMLYDNEQFRKHLGSFNWTFFTDGTLESLRDTINLMLDRFNYYSTQARSDFESGLNFELNFDSIINITSPNSEKTSL